MINGTITVTETPAWKIGDRVMIRNDVAGKFKGVVFTIVKFLPKNIEIKCETATVRVRPHQLVDVFSTEAAIIATDMKMMNKPVLPPLVCGMVVRYSGELYVILASDAKGNYRMARLGGEAGKYWTRVPRRSLEIVDVSQLSW
jgi:hypothetical protein